MKRDEIQHVVLGMQVNYQGIFNLADLLVMVDAFFKRRGYTKVIMSHNEKKAKSGRTLNLRLRPFRQIKKKQIEVQLWLNVIDYVDINKEIDGIKVNMNRGKVKAVVDAFIIDNERGGWEAKPEYTIIRSIFDKFLFRNKGKDYAGMVKADADDLKEEIASFLNLNKFVF